MRSYPPWSLNPQGVALKSRRSPTASIPLLKLMALVFGRCCLGFKLCTALSRGSCSASMRWRRRLRLLVSASSSSRGAAYAASLQGQVGGVARAEIPDFWMPAHARVPRQGGATPPSLLFLSFPIIPFRSPSRFALELLSRIRRRKEAAVTFRLRFARRLSRSARACWAFRAEESSAFLGFLANVRVFLFCCWFVNSCGNEVLTEFTALENDSTNLIG